MPLPINIDQLINVQIIEAQRLEFKKGWQPLEIVQTISAFANDIDNLGGGYIIIGVETYENGLPKFPPSGIQRELLDKIQKELLQQCAKIIPPYFPIIEVVNFKGKNLIILWVPGGDNRPYKAPDSYSHRGRSYYIRKYSSTKRASLQEEIDLIKESQKIPFDDQINHGAQINDLNITHLKDYLSKIKSDLLSNIDRYALEEIGRKMNILSGPKEYLKPKNIGLLFFSNNPIKFFSGAGIDIIEFQNDDQDTFTEKKFRGPIYRQILDVIDYINNNLIIEKITKLPGMIATSRIFNYKINAIKESLVNAVYHRSYENEIPIEVRIFPNRIEIISYPGPLPPLNRKILESGEKIIARKYRNRRIGDFLKELHLTEGRGTGIIKIKKEMLDNGSPAPLFKTDEDLSYFLTILKVHDAFAKAKLSFDVKNILRILNQFKSPLKKTDIIKSNISLVEEKILLEIIKYLLVNNLIALTTPDKETNEQRYLITHLGDSYIQRHQT